jgi:hypothetical protein
MMMGPIYLCQIMPHLVESLKPGFHAWGQAMVDWTGLEHSSLFWSPHHYWAVIKQCVKACAAMQANLCRTWWQLTHSKSLNSLFVKAGGDLDFPDGRKRYTVHPVLKIGIFSIVQGEYSELLDSIYYWVWVHFATTFWPKWQGQELYLPQLLFPWLCDWQFARKEIVVDKIESLKVQSRSFFSFVLELRFHLYNLLRFF